MSYKLIVLAVSATTGLAVCASAALADEPVTTDVEIVATAEDPGGGGGGAEEGDGDAAGPACVANANSVPVYRVGNIEYGAFKPDGFEELEGAEQLWQAEPCADGSCPPGFALEPDRVFGCVAWFGFGVAPPTLTVDDLWPGAYDEARNRIPLPDVAPLAPPVFQGTLVNAPLWLAVTPPDPVTARAEAGAVWAQVDATFVGLTWDMGVPGTDDDVIECDGAGDPWTGEEPIWAEDQWPTPPCGFNYEQPSTPEHTGNENYWYDVTVTAHWEVQLTGSDGRDLALDPIDQTFDFQYVVYELQTVGSR